MEFLRQLVYESGKLTEPMMQFDEVGDLPEGEDVEDEEEDICEDNDGDDACMQQQQVASISPASSTCSAVSQTSSSSSNRLICGKCGLRQKDTIMSCGHAVCGVCFENLVGTQQQQHSDMKLRGQRRKRVQKQLFCPFDSCKQAIKPNATKLCLDL